MKILIVEDDVPIAAMYEMKLKSAGLSVQVAYNGEQGLSVVNKFKPNLILLDLKMPVMDGEEMLVKLRQTKAGAKIRVIILTNISKDEAPAGLRFLHIDRYIVKAHHTPSQVLDIVQEVLAGDKV